MPDSITLNIPIKSHLKKYLTHKFGEEHSVSKKSWFGRYLVDLLDKDYRKTKTILNESSYYTVGIPNYIFNEVGFDISNVKLKHLNDMINKVFLNDMISYIEVSVGNKLHFLNEHHNSLNKQNVQKAIKQFLDFYNINEDELSVDTVYKSYFRNKKKDKSKNSTENKTLAS